MPAKKRPTKAEQKRREEQSEAAKPDEQPEQQVTGVLVTPVKTEDGGLTAAINTVGDVRPTEILTILKMGIKVAGAGLDD